VFGLDELDWSCTLLYIAISFTVKFTVTISVIDYCTSYFRLTQLRTRLGDDLFCSRMLQGLAVDIWS
jgi:hypothetical protein